MKKIYIYISVVISFCFLWSCSKEELAKKQFEGTWDVIHYELQTKMNGYVVLYQKEDCNPNDPDEDVKGRIVISYLEDNLYYLTLYGWDKTKGTWNLQEKCHLVQDDNYFYDVLDEKRENPAKINVENNTLIIEYSNESVFNDIVTYQYFKYIFKKVG